MSLLLVALLGIGSPSRLAAAHLSKADSDKPSIGIFMSSRPRSPRSRTLLSVGRSAPGSSERVASVKVTILTDDCWRRSRRRRLFAQSLQTSPDGFLGWRVFWQGSTSRVRLLTPVGAYWFPKSLLCHHRLGPTGGAFLHRMVRSRRHRTHAKLMPDAFHDRQMPRRQLSTRLPSGHRRCST